MSSRRLVAAIRAVCVVFCTFTGLRSASAGQLERVASGRPVRWPLAEVAFVVDVSSAPGVVAAEDLRAAVERAGRRWNELPRLALPRLTVGSTPSTIGAPRHDGRNSVALVLPRSCMSERGRSTPCDPRAGHARTRLYTVDAPGDPRDGIVDEADIELDASFAWGTGADRAARLEAVLVHELGHVLGLDHSCAADATAARDPDYPLCTNPRAMASLMYPNALEPGRALVLDPDSDARDTLTAIYPAASGCGAKDAWLGVACVIASSVAALAWTRRRRAEGKG